MFDDTYRTIKRKSKGFYKDKGSKFIAHAIPVSSEENIKEELAELKNHYHDARHHCYAWALGPTRDAYRINDDGEPSGTAGKPIYGQILSNDLTMLLIVVIRYFGGIKLGVRGLINAYKAAAADAIACNTIIEKIVKETYTIDFEYEQMNDIMRVIKENDLDQLSHEFALQCRIDFAVRKTESNRIYDLFSSLKNVKIQIKSD
ncbi:MAG: IMPACT family protein [Bacteroidota bacterium]